MQSNRGTASSKNLSERYVGLIDGRALLALVLTACSAATNETPSDRAPTVDAMASVRERRPDAASTLPDARSSMTLADSHVSVPDATMDVREASRESSTGVDDVLPDHGVHENHPACEAGAPCDGGVCIAEACVAPTCSDGLKDGEETAVDCGGSCAPCPPGEGCLLPADCTSLVCMGAIAATAAAPAVLGICQAPTCSDTVQNEGESDVDCGGPHCPPCAAGKTCSAHTDCASMGCDYRGHCALAASCTQHHGGDTCGPGEDTELGANPALATDEESCCTSLPIPGTTLTLDKYLITAGRVRAWVERLAGNLRAFTETIPASNPNWDPRWNQYIPSTMAEVEAQLGPYPAPLTPSPYSPSDTNLDTLGLPTGNWLGQWRDGCSMGAPGAPDGARTWWTDHLVGSDMGPFAYPQDFLDDKMINCIDSYLLTAFCIWDGGHLATDEEMAAAWGAGPLPWSAAAPMVLIDQTSQEPVGTDAMGRDARSYIVHEFGLSDAEFIAPYTYNYDPYHLGADNSIHIPAPGRFPLGAGPYGHMDLAGSS
jgi:hypothetical protein